MEKTGGVREAEVALIAIKNCTLVGTHREEQQPHYYNYHIPL
jgi:hypothetical protein